MRDREPRTCFDPADHVTAKVVAEALANDVWVYPAGSGPVPEAPLFGCPFVVNEDEIKLMVDVVAAAVTTVVKELA